MNSLITSTATALVAQLKAGDVTPHDCLDALEARIAAVDAKVNALPILCFDRARRNADALMKKPVEERGVLAGLPVPIKDLSEVEGVRTTHGSLIFKDHISPKSDFVVEMIEKEGGVVYGKTNVPEFGAGGNTFNSVFGRTHNPHDLARTSSGSSGGAAAALAAGMAWIAHGSDMGGSLRNPASFCGIVGMRPTAGKVPANNDGVIDQTLGVQGPMARNVEDLALCYDAMAGEHVGDILSKHHPAGAYGRAARSGWAPKRVAYTANFGITPVDPEVEAITRAAAQRFAEAGAIVEEATPDLSGVHDAFRVLRARLFATDKAELLLKHRDKFKPDLVWNIEQGMKLTADEIAAAEVHRTKLVRRMGDFLSRYDLLLAPATIVAAFPVEQIYVTECAGYTFPNYIEWLSIAYAPTMCAVPALSLPCGFTKQGLPVGLQVIAPTNCDERVIAGARCLEGILGLDTTRPVEPR